MHGPANCRKDFLPWFDDGQGFRYTDRIKHSLLRLGSEAVALSCVQCASARASGTCPARSSDISKQLKEAFNAAPDLVGWPTITIWLPGDVVEGRIGYPEASRLER